MNWHVKGKKCCKDCFDDAWLRQQVERLARETGPCGYCGLENGDLVEVSELSGHFENLLTLYAPSNSPRGDPLYYLLQDHWGIFNEQLFESGGAATLIEDIMLGCWDDDNGEPPVDANELYIQKGSDFDYIERFEEFLQNAKETEKVDPDFPEVLREDIWRFEEIIAADTILYRARVGYQCEQAGVKVPWAGPDIGANPTGPPSRANRTGKVVLYCADRQATAISEVRPARGRLVSVCELGLRKDLRVLDLRRGLKALNPFLVEDGLLPYWLELEDLLDRIAWALSKPLERDDSPSDYRPSQNLSEFAEDLGFEGIHYPSAMDEQGTNLVIFDPAKCVIRQSQLVKITALTIEFTDQLWRLTDDFPEHRPRA
jgi:RES domain-containing protein